MKPKHMSSIGFRLSLANCGQIKYVALHIKH